MRTFQVVPTLLSLLVTLSLSSAWAAPAAASPARDPMLVAAQVTPGGDPPLGQYGCTTFYSGNYAGDFVLQGDGTYVWYDEPGTYTYDPASGQFTWLSGPVTDLGYGGEFRAVGSPHPAGPGQMYQVNTIVLTGTEGSQSGDLISCEFEG